MSKLKKHPIIQDDKIIGYEQKEKEIKIVVCNKKEADEIILLDKNKVAETRYFKTINRK